jgi:hypothetical protein
MQAEPEDELRAAEPTLGDSFLNAFQWPDFDPSMTMRSLKKKVRIAICLVRGGKNIG